MHAGNGMRETQSETAAGRVPARLAPIEAAQYRLPLLGRDPRAVVGDRDAEARSVAEQVHRHVTCFRRELDRIFDQVRKRFEKQVTVPL